MNEAIIRDEPGEYRVVARYRGDGGFSVSGESVRPIVLTVRVEDAWSRMPEGARRYSYSAAVRRDGEDEPSSLLEDVAPDARIFLDFSRCFTIDFT